jgi:hypothetical protein
MIPDFVDGTNLPIGGYACSLAEIKERFVYNDCRRRLFTTLIAVFALAKRCGFLHALVGGSYPTGKECPGDIDVTWFCTPGTSKSTVDPNCIQIMEDRSDKGNFLFVPFDEGSVPTEYGAKLDRWSYDLGYDVKSNTPRGVLLVNLEDFDYESC